MVKTKSLELAYKGVRRIEAEVLRRAEKSPGRKIRLSPDRKINRRMAKNLQAVIRDESFHVFAVPVELIMSVEFDPPEIDLPPKMKTTTFAISRALSAANILHSYMTMKKKLRHLYLDRIKELAAGALVPAGIVGRAKKARLIEMLWEAVEKAEQGKPPVLTTAELYAILEENKALQDTCVDLKTQLRGLTKLKLHRVAESKGLEVDEKTTKLQIIDLLLSEKGKYIDRLKRYKAKRLLQRQTIWKTPERIREYLLLRQTVCGDLPKTAIRSLRWKMKPFNFKAKELWCLGYREDSLVFASIPAVTEVLLRKENHAEVDSDDDDN
jgi:hypothetical protein